MKPLAKHDIERLLRHATYASVGVAAVLILVKLTAWTITDSVSLLATLMDSCLDAAASMLNLLAVRQALMPADRQYRFGYGKLESIAGLGQGVFILASATLLFFEATHRIIYPQALQHMDVGLWVMGFSIIATLGLVSFQRHVVKITQSTAISADALHYQTDLLMNIAVIIALLLSTWGLQHVDAFFGLGIGAYILYSGYQIIRLAMRDLMDKEMPQEDRQRIKEVVLAHADVKGCHDLRTRKSGITYFIQLHLELDGQITLAEAHRIADNVEASIATIYPNSEILIHEDPASLNESHRVVNGSSDNA